MTVEELIEQLQKCNPKAQVVHAMTTHDLTEIEQVDAFVPYHHNAEDGEEKPFVELYFTL